MSEESEQFVPKSQYDEYVKLVDEAQDRAQRLFDEKEQLEEALKQIKGGIHKASDEPLPPSEITVRVKTWRRCREIAMDLLHIPIEGDELELTLKLDNGYLVGITQKGKHQ